MTMSLDLAIAHVREEVQIATARYASFNGPHEGYAVLLEEVDELWDEIKANDPVAQTGEAIQVAAMAIRFLMDQNQPPQRPIHGGYDEAVRGC